MTQSHEPLKDDPRYEARLRAQHGMVLGAGALPAGVGAGLFMALPPAQSIVGFPLGLLPAGVMSVLVSLGFGLLVLAAVQGVPRLLPGFWNLRHSLAELSTDQRLACYTAVGGLFFLGLGIGFGLAFLLM